METTANSNQRLPVVFLSHGAPTLALDPVSGADFTRLAASLPRPGAILAISAHWERTPLAIGTAQARELLYDFSGFDEALYRVRYPAPAAPDLVQRLGQLLPGAANTPARPWDHGVWVPLLHLFPDADVPVAQISLPSTESPRALFQLGRDLRALRDEGVLILASGGMVHNLGRLDWSGTSRPESWALDFEAWVRGALDTGEIDRLLDLHAKAPDLALAHPTLEHFLPLLVALGAADDGASVRYPIEGFEFGSLSRLGVQLG